MISFGKEKARTEPTRTEVWAPEQQALFKMLAPIIQKGLTEPVAKYPGQMFVPKTPEEEAYLGRVPGLAEQIAAARGRLRQPAYEITPETTEQYYQEAIRAPAMREWGETVEPLIREAYAGPGYWGSARAGAQVRGAEELATTLGKQRAELYYADEMAKRTAAEAAAGREATYGLPYAAGEAEMLGTAGAYARQVEQEKVLADLQRWLMGEEIEGVSMEAYSPYMQLAFQLLGLSPYVVSTSGKSTGFDLGIEGKGLAAALGALGI